MAPEVSPIPRSLSNIYTEYCQDLGYPMPANGDLTPWASNGVLLLNRVLTVQPGEPGSHRKKGWEQVTECAIKALVAREGERRERGEPDELRLHARRRGGESGGERGEEPRGEREREEEGRGARCHGRGAAAPVGARKRRPKKTPRGAPRRRPTLTSATYSRSMG